MEDGQAVMERFVRQRAVAPVSPGSPRLSSQERCSWWEFCLWMEEFLRGVIRDPRIDRIQAEQLVRLQWIVLKGTYVFATPDPELCAEQRRYVELCMIIGAAFAMIVDDPEGIDNTFADAFGPARVWPDGDPKLPAEEEAVIESRLRGWKNWEDARSPIAWVQAVARLIHDSHCPRSMEQEANMSSLDAPSPTGDPYAALLSDPKGDQVIPDIHARVDLTAACVEAGLAPETSLLALGRYNGVPRSVATEVLGLSKQDVDAAAREMTTAMPALQARLEPYRKKSRMKRI